MPAKLVIRRLGNARLGSSVVVLASVLLGSMGSVPSAAKPPLPTILLYPATSGDIAALVDLRTRLRLDGHVDVLTYDPESAAIQRAAAEASHPEWLVNAPPKDTDRLVLARALGVAFYAVVSPGRTSDTTHVELVETAVSARTFDWSGTNRQYGVRAIESQVADSLAHPLVLEAGNAPLSASPPIVTPPVPSPAPPVPSPALTPSAPIAIKLPPSLTAPAIKPTVKTPVLPIVKALPLSLPAPAVAKTAAVAKAPPVTLPPAVTLPLPAPIAVPRAQVSVQLPSALAAVPTPTVPIKRIPTQIAQAVPVAPTSKPPSVTLLTPKPPSVTLPTVKLPTTGTQMAMLPRPKPYVPEPDTLLTLPAPPPPTAIARPEDLSAIKPLLVKGDSALDGGDVVGAISFFRQAVNGAPRSVVPRLKLAQAYEKGGLTNRALDEARRALEIAPDSPPVQQLLADLDQQNGTSDGTLIRGRVMVQRNPADPTAHGELADALWNSGDLSGAEAEYKAAKVLSPAGDHAADAQLARLYATEARYADALRALQNAGPDGYALAVKIVKNRADTLSSTLDASRAAFDGGKSTREQYYDDAKKLSAQAQGLAGFVAQVTPPARYKLSHLHRMLSANLLAQEAAALVTFIETGDSKQRESLSALERAAATEMLTAQATEEKLGLWKK